jgi:hypothetical protein
VIGLGGGPDLLAALENGMSHVVGAEINAGTLDVLDRAYRDFVDLDRDRLDLVLADGRSYVRQFEDRFDVVQMTGADTYAASASSGSMLAENYLYTVEAFRDYLGAVKDDGLVSITRFAHESGKVVTTMIAALRSMGVAEPARHIVVTIQGPVNYRWRNVLVKKTPFTAEELERIDAQVARSEVLGPKCTIPVYAPIGFGFNSEMAVAVRPSLDGGPQALNEVVRSPDYDFTPATDDKPFFFNFKDFELSFTKLFGGGERVAKHQFDVTDYLVIVIQISMLSLLLILGPLVVFKLGGERMAASLPLALYFFGIGVGFMFLEICLMQKCGLFLGHPNYSISTVLFSLLVFSGIGSYTTGRWNAAPFARVTFAMAGITLWVLFFATLAHGIFEDYLTLPIASRIAILVAMVAPLGFCVGMPFPTCFREVEERAPRFSPWAFGTNGFASVVGSLATIPMSMQIGFSNTLWVGLAAYLVAWLGFVLFLRTTR